MERESIRIEDADLDMLLSAVNESVARIGQDPDGAYERLLQRHNIDFESVACRSIDDIETALGIANTPAPHHYGSRTSGSLLMGWERVLTQPHLDKMADEIMRFDTSY